MADRTIMPIMGATLLSEIPWAMIAPHNAQALRNHGQSLERLAQRGGLAATEAIDIINGRRWGSTLRSIEAERYLVNKVREWRAANGESLDDRLQRAFVELGLARPSRSGVATPATDKAISLARGAIYDAQAALTEIVGCFDAALTEGLTQALAETTDMRLKDLVERRLMHAHTAARKGA